jgi:hypothetical protein
MSCSDSGSLPAADLVVDRATVVVERDLPQGHYKVTLDAAHSTMTIRGPLDVTFRAMSRSAAHPEAGPRVELQYFGARDALLLFYLPPQTEWVATKREAPL